MTDEQIVKLVQSMQADIKRETVTQRCEEGARSVVSTVVVNRAIRPVLEALYELHEKANLANCK